MNETPAAIVRESSSLSEAIGRIKSMHSDHMRSSVEKALAIGAELNALKERCEKDGEAWLPTLEKTGVEVRMAQIYMFVANNKGQTLSFMRNSVAPPSLRDVVEHVKTELLSKGCDRDCRLSGGCKKCKRGLFSPPPPPEYPENAKPIFDLVPEWVKLSKAARTLGKRLRKLEASLPFRASFKGRKEGYLSDKIVNVYTSLDSLVPAEPCAECDCDLDPNEDAEPCAACGGKGFLTAFDKRSKDG